MSYDIYCEADLGAGPVDVGDVWQNYTSNVSGMWRKASPATDGLAGLDGFDARYAVKVIESMLREMESDPDAYRAMNPPNKWGDYESQKEWLERLIQKLNKVPNAIVRVSR